MRTRSGTGLGGLSIVVLLFVVDLASASSDLRLVQAVKHQDTANVQALLPQVDVNAAEPDGATALHWAVQYNDLTTVDLLIAAGARVSALNDYGVSPLSLACVNGSAAMIEKLLAAGANPHIPLPTGETALMTAARTGNVDAVTLLLDSKVDVDARERIKGQTALMWAVSEQHVNVARTLVERGADVTARSDSGFTPLMFAARSGDLELTRLLLDSGADVNTSVADGSTALLVATVRGHLALAEFLLEQGADPNADGAGYTPLHWASSTWESIMTHDYHVESGEWRALAGLWPDEKQDFIRLLLAHGADINAVTTKAAPRYGFTLFKGSYVVGATPFLLASLVADVPVMRLLLRAGADPLVMTGDRTTALMMAAGIARTDQESLVPESRHLEAVNLALELGVDIDAANGAGYTALHAVGYSGLNSVAQLLVANGADLNARARNGQTPLSVAEGVVVDMQVYTQLETAALLRRMGGISEIPEDLSRPGKAPGSY